MRAGCALVLVLAVVGSGVPVLSAILVSPSAVVGHPPAFHLLSNVPHHELRSSSVPSLPITEANPARGAEEPESKTGPGSCAPAPCVVETLVLFNDTLVPGNLPASNELLPYAVAYDGGKGKVFVANLLSSNVGVISDATNGVVATVEVGNGPSGVVYDSESGVVYVSNYGQGTVSIIDAGATSSTHAAKFLGLPGSDGYYLLGAGAAVAMAAGVGVALRSRGRKTKPPVGSADGAIPVPPGTPPSV